MIVFTNGCFDILHPGHVDLLERAKSLGDRLIVGINSDESVRRIKGPGRPFMKADERAKVLMGLRSVDDVRIFDELTPEKLIAEIRPDVLVKGGDWKPDEIVGSDLVLQNGGSVRSLPLLDGHSSSDIVSRIRTPEPAAAAIGGIAARSLSEHEETMRAVANECGEAIEDCAALILSTVPGRRKNTYLAGTAAVRRKAQHITPQIFRPGTKRNLRVLPADPPDPLKILA